MIYPGLPHAGKLRTNKPHTNGAQIHFLVQRPQEVMKEADAVRRYQRTVNTRTLMQAHPIRLRGETQRAHRTHTKAFCQAISKVFLYRVIHDVLGLDDIARH